MENMDDFNVLEFERRLIDLLRQIDEEAAERKRPILNQIAALRASRPLDPFFVIAGHAMAAGFPALGKAALK